METGKLNAQPTAVQPATGSRQSPTALSVHPRQPATTRRLCTHSGRVHGLPNLRGGEGPRRQPRIAETNLNLNDFVAPHARESPCRKGRPVSDASERLPGSITAPFLNRVRDALAAPAYFVVKCLAYMAAVRALAKYEKAYLRQVGTDDA